MPDSRTARSGAFTEDPYRANLRLSKAEYALRAVNLQSMPRYMTIVLGNACNIDCVHCYQLKNNDSLLRPREIGESLRRELKQFYPFLSTLRLMGGEAFYLKGFEDLLDDVGATVCRPLVSLSTNATMIDDIWAERIVRTPFKSVTISIDGGTVETFDRLRRGSHLLDVLENVRRIQRAKERLHSAFPRLDSFFVLMRSNFREIPAYLDMVRHLGIPKVAFSTMAIDDRNLSREPTLADEVLREPAELAELHALLMDTLPRMRPHFARITVNGVAPLFAGAGLDASFLNEFSVSLYPDNEDAVLDADTVARQCIDDSIPLDQEGLGSDRPAVAEATWGDQIELCPNPWTTIFLTENGDVSLCFQSTPVGNLYATPVREIWNGPEAVAKRRDMIAGRYLSTGCSEQWCSWREGIPSTMPSGNVSRELAANFREIAGRATSFRPIIEETPVPDTLTTVRRLLAAKNTRITQLETDLRKLSEEARRYVEHLEARIGEIETEARSFLPDLEKSHTRITELERECAAIYGSGTWRLVTALRTLKQRLAGSRALGWLVALIIPVGRRIARRLSLSGSRSSE